MKQLLRLLLLISGAIYSQEIPFDPVNSEGKLYEYATYATPKTEVTSLEDFVNNKEIRFKNLESENHSFGFTSGQHWVKFKIRNSKDKEEVYYLETARPITDIATLYQDTGTAVQVFKNGDQIPFDEKQVAHRQTVFKLVLPPNSITDYYLYLESDGETLNLPLNVYSETDFLLTNYKQQLFLGLFYGVLALAGLIYLFFFTSLREQTFLHYGLYVISIALLQAALDGFIHQYIFPEGGYLNSRMVLITALFSNFFLLKYCESFLNIKDQLPSFKKAYTIIYIVIIALFVMLFIHPKTLAMVYPISNVNGLLSLILILSSLFTLTLKKVRIDIYFSIGIFFLVVGLLGFVLNNLSLVPNNFYTLNSAKFGAGFEVIFLSLSMTNLIRVLRLEKEKSQDVALKNSQEISQLKTYFMSNVSHEIRTPINAIMGVVQAELKNPRVSEEQRQSLETINNASMSLLGNVNDILDFERIEKNELILRPTTFNPSKVLKQLSNNWKIQATKKDLSYVFKIDENIPEFVEGDVDRFVQVINNVLANAVKFTHKGSVKAFVSCQSIGEEEQSYEFKFIISDTGVGMDKNERSNVFDSFNQMRLNHKRNFAGIGLGLSIVKHLIHLFKGSIHIESEPNRGTDVIIKIPFNKVTKVKECKNAEAAILSDSIDVLIVEDNKLNQLVMKKILSRASNVCYDIANDGQEALNAMAEKNYDIILMDLQMPIMDGYEATKNIRSGAVGLEKSKTPIIAVTADALEKTRDLALEIGMNDYITKPVDEHTLFEKMARCQEVKQVV